MTTVYTGEGTIREAVIRGLDSAVVRTITIGELADDLIAALADSGYVIVPGATVKLEEAVSDEREGKS